jgi:hypothetical protein
MKRKAWTNNQVTKTAAMGLSPTVPRVTKVKKGPNKMSLATASKTLLAPIYSKELKFNFCIFFNW